MRRRDFVTGAVGLAACGRLPKAYAQPSSQTNALLAVSADDDRLPTGFYNFTGSNLPNWASALEAQQRGLSNAIIGCLAIQRSQAKARPATNLPPMPRAC